MKAKDLVIGKIYIYKDPTGHQVKYAGVIARYPYLGQHDFDAVERNGCICTDEEVEDFISETRQPDAPKYDRGQKISLYGLLIILGLMVFLAVVSQNLA